MTKLLPTIAAAATALLVSCEPIPSYPPPGYRPQGPNTFPREDPRYRYNQRDQRRDAPDNRYGPRDEQPPQPDNFQRPPARDQYPTAERTDNPNQVLSPYAPYNVIDVEGFRSGQLAKDPSNGKIFRVP